MSNLTLTLKAKWYDMIASGVKTEEYREIKKHWLSRITNYDADLAIQDIENTKQHLRNIYFLDQWQYFDTIIFRNGYSKTARTMVVECLGISIGKCRPEWSDNAQGEHFVIKMGKIISNK